MNTPSVTVAFAPETPDRTLAACLERLLRNIPLETPREESR